MDYNTFIFLLFLLTLPILLLLKSLLHSNQKARSPTPPGPPPLPIIGNFHQLGSASLPETFARLATKYGPLLYLKLGSRNVLVANSVKTAEEILRSQDLSFCSRPNLTALRKLSYNRTNVAFSPYNEYWREMRKLCTLHLLSAKRVQSFGRVRGEEVRRTMEAISERASRSETVDLNEAIARLTSTVVSRVAFGKRYERGDDGEGGDFYRMAHLFERSISSFYFADYFPWLGWVDRLSGKIDRLDEAYRVCDAFYQELIEEHLRSDKDKATTDEPDMIDVLLQLREDQSLDIALDNIKAILMDLYFASTDTTSVTITWIMTALIKNPLAMKKVQAEIRGSIKGKTDELNEEHIASAKLPYLNAVIKEAMRLYSTVPLLLPRETMHNCTIDGYEIPAKTLVYVNAWAISRDPELWNNPEEFSPERFLPGGDKSDVDFRTSVELIPFGAGRRGCPGINMALSMIEITVANLIYHFDWKLANGARNEDLDDEFQEGVALHRKTPLCLVPEKVIL